MTTLCEFKVGKCVIDTNTQPGKMVVKPSPTKGKLALVRDDAGVQHCQWWDRTKGKGIGGGMVADAADNLKCPTEDDAMRVTGLKKVDDYTVVKDCYLQRIAKVKDGRVYVLRFVNSRVRYFFWIQESDQTMDDEFVKKFNESVGCTTAPGAITGSSAANPTAGLAGALGGAANNEALQAQLMQILRGAGGNNPGANALAEQIAEQQKILRVGLDKLLPADLLIDKLGGNGEAMTDLQRHLPPENLGGGEKEEVLETFRCPQLRSNMGVLWQAINSDQLPILMQMLGLTGGLVSGEDPLESLCKALEAKHKK